MKRIIIFTFSLLIILSGISFSQPHGKSDISIPMFRWWKIAQIRDQLNITESETTELDKIYQEVKTKMIDFKASAEKKMMILEMELGEAAFNKDVCLKLFKETQDIRTDIAMERFKFVLRTKEILKQERFDQLTEIYKEHRKKGRAQKQMRKSHKRMKQNRELSQNMMFEGPGEMESPDMVN